MKIKLLRDGKTYLARAPFSGADHVEVVDEECASCGVELKVAGSGQRPSADDRAWEADARALCCGARAGLLRVEPDTIFGVREDEAVLRGRCRVY